MKNFRCKMLIFTLTGNEKYKTCFKNVNLLPVFAHQAHNHHQWEHNGGQNTQLQILSRGGGNKTHQRGAAAAAHITGQGKEGKHGGAAFGQGRSRGAEGAGPHDAYG